MYESPRPENQIFTSMWNILIESLNKKKVLQSHLLQLEVLCDLYFEYYELRQKVEEEGCLVANTTSQGETYKVNPNKQAKDNTVRQIALYTKSLGLEMVGIKEDAGKLPTNEPEEDWI